MSLAALPPEICQLIIVFLEDQCFAWRVFRRVSHYFCTLTEDVFARYFLSTCTVRFAGSTPRALL